MFTKQVQTLVSQLRNNIPEPAIRAFEDILGNCDQTLEHRAPVGVYVDGNDRIRGQYQRETLPKVCFDVGEPLAAITASNPAGYFSSDTCKSDCVTGGLAFRAIGPSAMDETRIETLYVGSLLDLCGNPYPTGSGSEPVRFQINAGGAAAGAANEALGKLVTWNGSAYVTTGPDIALIDYTTNGEFSKRWADGWQGWAVAKADRPNVTIASISYTAYEVMYVECQARFIEFSTTAAFAGGPPQTAAATVTNSWGADDYANAPATATIVDRLGKAPGAASGFTGLAIWDEIAGQYILVASSGAAPGDQLFRFQLTANKPFATASVSATLVDGALAPIGGPITVHDTVGEWQGLNGAFGWCVLKSDTSQYEIVWLEGQSRWMPFTLTADVAAGSATATAGTGWGRPHHADDPTGSFTVYDTKGLFTRAKNTAEGLAVWNDRTDKYEIVECQSRAGAIEGTFSAPVGLGDSTVAISVTDHWGTQQDVQAPGTITAEVRSDRYQHWTCPAGGKAVAIYDAIDDTYVVVDSEKVAHAIEFTTNSDGLGAAATVNFAAGGESPGGTANLSDVQGLFNRTKSGATGVGFWRNGVYTVVNCKSKAGGYAFTTKSTYSGPAGNVQANQIAYWGTQQDVQDPVTTQTIEDVHGEWYLSRDGAKGYAIFDNNADTYKAVWQETYAHHIRYVVAADFTAANSEFDVTIAEPHSGQDPSGATLLKVRNVNQRSGKYGEIGSAYLDTVNSSPNDVKYIDIEPKDPDGTKVRWGKCNTNWYKGAGKCDYISVQESAVCDWSSTSHNIPFDVTDSNYQTFPLPSSTTNGYKILLPKVQGCDPNIESGDVIAFMEASDGTYVCVSDYTDDAIGCAKLFTKSTIPGGWATMNGSDNASGNGGSGVDTVGFFVKGQDTAVAPGTNSGRWRVPVNDLAHHHFMGTTKLVVAETYDPFQPGDAIQNDSCSDTHSTAYDAFIRDGDDIVPSPPSNAVLCDDPFGPLNIENPNTPITYIERLDNSQDFINSAP